MLFASATRRSCLARLAHNCSPSSVLYFENRAGPIDTGRVQLGFNNGKRLLLPDHVIGVQMYRRLVARSTKGVMSQLGHSLPKWPS
jgi:hypothetical protein